MNPIRVALPDWTLDHFRAAKNEWLILAGNGPNPGSLVAVVRAHTAVQAKVLKDETCQLNVESGEGRARHGEIKTVLRLTQEVFNGIFGTVVALDAVIAEMEAEVGP